MTAAVYLRNLVRESRGSRGRLAFFVACLAVGVAAVVAVAGLAASLEEGIRSEARQMLAADLVVEGRRPLPPELAAELRKVPGVARTDVLEMDTVVAAPPDSTGRPGPSRLVELKAVGGTYPFYGALQLTPPRPLRTLLGDEGVVVAPELLAQLRLRPGEALRIGGVAFRIAGIVRAEPDRGNVAFALGPRVFLSLEGLGRTTLVTVGSRVRHRALLRLPEGAGGGADRRLASFLRRALPDGYRVETYAQAQPGLRNALRRSERFLSLVALLSLLVGGIGISQTVRAWIAGRLDAIAILKCLGMRSREVLALYAGQALLLGLAGSAAGAAAGLGLVMLAPVLLGDLLPTAVLRPWQPAALLRGCALGTAVSLLFSLPPLVSLLRVPPARVFRRDAEPLPGRRALATITAIALVVAVFGSAWFQSGSLRLSAWFGLAIAGSAALLAAAALGLSRGLAGWAPRTRRVWTRHGLAALGRPGAGTLGGVVAMGLGVLVVLAMALVQHQLAADLSAEIPGGSPTVFLVDIQTDQWPQVEALLEEKGATRITSVPVVTARLTAVDRTATADLARSKGEDRGRRWALTREQRLTYLRELPAGNRVVEGALWSDPARPEISVEQDYAGDLGIEPGSTLTFDMQGVPLDLAVTSVREVEWRTFGINFFLVVEPGVLEDAPQFRVAAARLPEGREQAFQDELVAAFPNVTLLRTRELLQKVARVLNRIALGVRILGGSTALAGLVILAGSISAGSVRRGREVALLKTLGMTRWDVVRVFSVEYAALGLVSGVLGAAGGTVLAWVVMTRAMELPWTFYPAACAAAVLGTVALSVLAGIAASAPALSMRPIAVLRQEA